MKEDFEIAKKLAIGDEIIYYESFFDDEKIGIITNIFPCAWMQCEGNNICSVCKGKLEINYKKAECFGTRNVEYKVTKILKKFIEKEEFQI